MTAIIDDDRPLIEAAQADPARFIELYERYFDRVYAFASSRTRNRAVAEDVTSEVFHQALAHIDQFEWRGVPFVAWLFRMASLGLYSEVSDTTRRRTHEIGIRIALGARPADIRWAVRVQALRPVATGMGAGFALALAIAPVVRGLLFGISPSDPRVFALTAIVLAVGSVAAAYFPGRRASRQNPIIAMRSE